MHGLNESKICIQRTKAMKALGFYPVVAILISIFLAPIWTLIVSIYIKVKKIEY